MHINSTTSQQKRTEHALAQRKRHWRRRHPGLEVAGELTEHLRQTALISRHRGQDHSHDFTLSPAKQRAVVIQQVERHAFETTGTNPLSRLLRTIQYRP